MQRGERVNRIFNALLLLRVHSDVRQQRNRMCPRPSTTRRRQHCSRTTHSPAQASLQHLSGFKVNKSPITLMHFFAAFAWSAPFKGKNLFSSSRTRKPTADISTDPQASVRRGDLFSNSFLSNAKNKVVITYACLFWSASKNGWNNTSE